MQVKQVHTDRNTQVHKKSVILRTGQLDVSFLIEQDAEITEMLFIF